MPEATLMTSAVLRTVDAGRRYTDSAPLTPERLPIPAPGEMPRI